MRVHFLLSVSIQESIGVTRPQYRKEEHFGLLADSQALASKRWRR